MSKLAALVVAAIAALALSAGAGAKGSQNAAFAISLVSVVPPPAGTYGYGTVTITVERTRRQQQIDRVQVMTLCEGDYQWGDTAYVSTAPVTVSGRFGYWVTSCEVYVVRNFVQSSVWYQPESNVITFSVP